jgi:outer membrane protein assembly factor BamD (BamD/ComL family)
MRVFVILVMVLIFTPTAMSQGGVGRGPDPSVIRDAELEKDSMHNLVVARHYFKLKKAYKAAVARCEEIIAGNPNFSRIDEVLYIAGVSSLRLAENRGKQSAPIAPEKLKEDAREYLLKVVNDHPQSDFLKESEKELRAMGVEVKKK